mmetsp:Transcript_105407/g.251025  ORF Transcript_105407/g.251025 Transcript_105407/m.251025 type:complete len:81 (-) Transcript_105407:248-490(-)
MNSIANCSFTSGGRLGQWQRRGFVATRNFLVATHATDLVRPTGRLHRAKNARPTSIQRLEIAAVPVKKSYNDVQRAKGAA